MKKILKIIAIIIAAIIVLSIIFAGCDSEDTSTPTEETTIEYTDVDATEMINQLNDNALVAEDYTEQYVAVTGYLSNIDSDGTYFSIRGNDEWEFVDIMCYFMDDSQVEQIKNCSIDDKLVVKGQITDVGEVLGYELDVDSIEVVE